MTNTLQVIVNGRTELRQPFRHDSYQDSQRVADVLLRVWPDLQQRGRVAVIGEDEDGVSYILLRN